MVKLRDTALLTTEAGNAEQRFLPVDTVTVPPEISADEQELWVPDDEEYWYGVGASKAVNTNCLTRFVQLADQSEREILRFARNWGLLGLCEHRKPATHVLGRRDGRERFLLLPYEGCSPQASEAFDDWRTYSRQFRTFIDVAQSLHRGDLIVGDSAWDALGNPRRRGTSASSGDTVERQRQRFARAVNLLLASSGIQPIMQWNPIGPAIAFGVFAGVKTTLFSALAMQLAFTVSDCKVAICSACHSNYHPRRRSRSGEANYCPTCRRRGVDVRIRVQRHRDRQRK